MSLPGPCPQRVFAHALLDQMAQRRGVSLSINSSARSSRRSISKTAAIVSSFLARAETRTELSVAMRVRSEHDYPLFLGGGGKLAIEGGQGFLLIAKAR